MGVTLSPALLAKINNALSATEKAELQAIVAQADQASKPRALTAKVAVKGGISVYGLNIKTPVTLYASQWERLAEFMPTVLQLCKRTEGPGKDGQILPIARKPTQQAAKA